MDYGDLNIKTRHRKYMFLPQKKASELLVLFFELRRQDSNLRPSGYEPDELPLLHSAI